jgi:hypothetical protein
VIEGDAGYDQRTAGVATTANLNGIANLYITLNFRFAIDLQIAAGDVPQFSRDRFNFAIDDQLFGLRLAWRFGRRVLRRIGRRTGYKDQQRENSNQQISSIEIEFT